MGTPFKMKGHTLPGPNQKKSPMKIEPISGIAAIIGGIKAATTAAALAKAATTAVIATGVGKGASAIGKGKARKV